MDQTGPVEFNFNRELGQNVARARSRHKISACRLAADVGVHRNTVCRWEHGDTAIPLWYLARIADVLRINIVMLLPPAEHVWGPQLRPALHERDPKKDVQSERDPWIHSAGERRRA